MDAFNSSQQPDEGYSEDPLNPLFSTGPFLVKGRHGDASAVASLRGNPEFPSWLLSSLVGLSVGQRTRLAMALLEDLPTSVIADIVLHLHPRLYIDFVRYLPPEVCLKILGYLDPVSLINVARACRTWYGLALDRHLWERLFYLEGWRAEGSEIRRAEELTTRQLLPGVGPLVQIQSSEDGHICKKRALSTSSFVDGEDGDMIMVDADDGLKQEPMEMDIPGSSIFGDARPSSGKSTLTLPMKALKVRLSGSSSASKGKGKAVDSGRAEAFSPSSKLALLKALSVPELPAKPEPKSTLPKSTLWTWDTGHQRYRMNWKYLYSMRRRLESNWERGKFVNFQFPHPDFPREGHSECIYSLQFNSEYLVSGSRDKTLRIWDMHTRRLIRILSAHHGSVLCLQFDSDPDEDIIVSGSSDSDVIIWRFSTGEVIQRLSQAHRESVLNVKFDKRILVTCSKDKTIKIFNRRPLKPGDMGHREVAPAPIFVRGVSYDVPSPLNEVQIIQPYTLIGCLDGHGAAVNAVQIFDREVVSASGDRHVKVWDWPNQVCTRTVVGHNKGIACVQYDGRRIVSGSSDFEVKVFDRQTGLEVASLRSHSNLVRTVQAGFGDLPNSVDEDMAEARRIDEEYFRAVESGAVPSVPSRGRPGNPGSRRPEDITSYGAKLPPGGGGGRYGRIVSGSYDASIIIWRRDKQGAWMAQHRLRHEQAATAARQTSSTRPEDALATAVAPLQPSLWPPIPAVTAAGSGTTTGSVADTGDRGTGASTQTQGARTATPPAATALQATQVESPIMATLTPSSIASYRTMINMFVPQGPAALAQALASYPSMLTQREHLDAVIAREPTPLLRSQLRQVATTALMRTRFEQNRQQEATIRNIDSLLSPPVAAGPGPATLSRAGTAPSSAAAEWGGWAGNPNAALQPPSPEPTTQPAIAVGTNTPASAELAQTAQATQQEQQQQPPTAETAVPAANAAHAAPTTAANTTLPAPPAAAAAPAQPPPVPAPAAAHHHHPHLPAENSNLARVFKLQFDATRIICCSQTSVIVGWDFCNGDPELEEVSRFFGTVD